MAALNPTACGIDNEGLHLIAGTLKEFIMAVTVPVEVGPETIP